ncbi:MAG: sigma 54-interacting transcriptional regulator [Acidobacteria bacterium]|nr:sigma 54-interacting transcriptional regulator [Acidobacteriota bacterium]
MTKPRTLGELRADGPEVEKRARRSVKDEMRENVLAKLDGGEPLFPGIVGYDDSVIPQIVNAILSRHNFILLGLRGQAKSRILRALVNFLDREIPVMAGCEINDNPFGPLCRACRLLVGEKGDSTPIAFLARERRLVEKLATPDVTVADILGDIDPIKAARGGLALSDELTIHYGLLPRAHRGIFALNELPDLAPKIQVGLFNIMQEGDIQVKGYPVRLPLDLCLVFTANPEDYTARGKIISPLKDRIGSEIRTHYPVAREEGMTITRQEAWLSRDGAGTVTVPPFVAEIVEEIAFQARQDKKIDKRSGVSQRMPITCLENVVSNAERRARQAGEKKVVPRVGDVYAAMTSLTGKFELEYEGEVHGADQVARELIRRAVGTVFQQYFQKANLDQVVQWFELGGTLKVPAEAPASELLEQFRKIQGLVESTAALGLKATADPADLVPACEFVLEGLHAHRRISRSEERGFYAEERPRPEPSARETPPRSRRPYQ